MGRRDGAKKFAKSTNRRKYKFAKTAKEPRPSKRDEKKAA